MRYGFETGTSIVPSPQKFDGNFGPDIYVKHAELERYKRAVRAEIVTWNVHGP